jgi:predicted kinase
MGSRRVFLITGLPASGKTTLARALAGELAAPLLSKDAIKEPLLDVLGAADPAASRALSDASFAVLFALADQHLMQTGTVVIEGNFRPPAHAAVVRALLARHAPSCCVQVLCRVPESLRQERLRSRGADPRRHPGHHDAAWVAQADRAADAFLDVEGPRHVHDSGVPDPEQACALVRSLAKRQLV